MMGEKQRMFPPNEARDRLSARCGDHPMQPTYYDENETVRFKHNAIVRFLLDAGPFDMNQLAAMNFSREDREQFAQLIGYSVGGFGELSYVRSKTYKRIAMPDEPSTATPPAGAGDRG